MYMRRKAVLYKFLLWCSFLLGGVHIFILHELLSFTSYSQYII